MKRTLSIALVYLLVAVLGTQLAAAQESLNVKIAALRTEDDNIEVTYPQFTGSGTVVKTANADLESLAQERLKIYRSDIKTIESEYAGTDIPLRYSYSLEPTVSIARPDLISLYFIEETYTGGAHGMAYFHGRSYGVVDGKAKLLTLQDLFKPGVDGRKLAGERVYAQLQSNPNAAWIDEGWVTATSAELTKEFVITPTALTFLIEPYAVGPYAAGAFFVKVPFEEFGDALVVPGIQTPPSKATAS